MKRIIRQTCKYVLADPFSYLSHFLFQPTSFKREFEYRSILKRAEMMLRLALPVLLCTYPFALVIRIVLHSILPPFYDSDSCRNSLGLIDPCFLLDTARGIMLGIIGSTIGAIIFGVTIGIAFDFAVGLAGGIVVNTTTRIAYANLIGLVYGLVIIVVVSTFLGLAANSEENNRGYYFFSGLAGSFLGLVGGAVGGLITGYLLGYFLGLVGQDMITDPGTSVRMGTLVGGLLGGIITGSAGAVLRGLAKSVIPSVRAVVEISRTVSLAFGTILGTIGGTIGTWAALRHMDEVGKPLIIVVGSEVSVAGGAIFLLCYFLAYYRLPLYPISSLSMLRAYLVSLKHKEQVFVHLHRSSLYWDERVFLPLPFLERLLLLAYKYRTEETLKELRFIVSERPLQLSNVLLTVAEIALSDLKQRTSLEAIAQASDQLAEIIPQETSLIDPQWIMPFVHLASASRAAARFCTPIGWQAKHSTLEEMESRLRAIPCYTAFKDASLNASLSETTHIWLEVAQKALATLEKMPERTRLIRNPYKPGIPLSPRDSLFVGRRDLALQIEEIITNASHSPPLLLNGERRVGKSSTLKQLPYLLGDRYIPIFYDGQRRGTSSKVSIFLGSIAESITQQINARVMSIKIRELSYEQLEEASRKNEAMVYHVFDRWLDTLERLLEQEDHVLLLTFDEFEELKDAGDRGYLDLELLLDWFRSIIQNYPRVVLLFSGLYTFDEMGISWSSHFVNVQTVKVGLLYPNEAYQLITRPTPDFSTEDIFDQSVVQKIMHITGYHPFLVQAICSALIVSLNASKRERATLNDVDLAVRQVLNGWNDYFSEQWDRTDKDQRRVLIALHQLGKADFFILQQYIELEDIDLKKALKTLIKRDIVLLEDESYRITSPITSEWIGKQ